MRDAKGRFVKGHTVLPGRDGSGRFQKTVFWSDRSGMVTAEDDVLDSLISTPARPIPGNLYPYKRPSLWQRIKAKVGL